MMQTPRNNVHHHRNEDNGNSTSKTNRIHIGLYMLPRALINRSLLVGQLVASQATASGLEMRLCSNGYSQLAIVDVELAITTRSAERIFRFPFLAFSCLFPLLLLQYHVFMLPMQRQKMLGCCCVC